MARFTTRVELHDADWDDYVALYKQMARQGFTDTIELANGKLKMPPAEYNYDGSASKEDVLAKAKTAASAVVGSYAVLVTESSGRTWHGLDNA
jgi:hypothetical protein